MTKLLSIFAILTLAAPLTACGFEPLHGTKNNANIAAQAQLAQIDIGIIPDEEGQFLRNALIDRFYQSARPSNPTYALSITPIKESRVNLDITKSADTTRGQLILTTSLKLNDKKTGKALLSRSLRSTISYNKLGSEFATIVSENNARKNALNDLARQIELQLNLYFKR